MSRSALTRHALQKSLRVQNEPDEPPEQTERHVKQDELSIHGNDTTYNLNTLLHQNILQSAYFHELYKFKTYHEVVDEIYYRVDHAEPWSPGTARIPSSCFCLLHKFCLMRLTRKQMQGLLRHKDSPYIRVVGFLYLRFTCDPDELWTWFEPYLEDSEEFNASANPSIKTTIGEWLIRLLEENNYFGTILPRIPKKIEDGIKVKLLLLSRKKKRAKENLAIISHLKPGTKVRSMYADEENEPAMYDAVIESVEEGNQFWVSFPAYGNTEKVSLGDIEFTSGKQHRERSPARSGSARRSSSRSRGRDRGRDRDHRRDRKRREKDRHYGSNRDRSRSRVRYQSRSRSRSASRDQSRRDRSRSRSRSYAKNKSGDSDITENLLQQVRERERRKAEAVGRDYASRPASYKGSLSLKLDRWTTRKRSRSPVKREEVVVVQPGMSKGDEPHRSSSPSSEEIRMAEKRLEELRKMYGDASSKTKD
ncbi:Putative RNA binding protein [Plasmopara halstedii]|uniref:Pre-mRNA-splicing factor 38 n=1 Tax=Plasmopara halstedii TaxID=4781 RepID=A0A0P1ARE8_PLAHL|nr:Putative RNA binding protein [Plasmopara halstedii]CEG44173.1 Putative RNA binding protein [Plasmopara halstedii]|eukprot:XP_024580542.1 Putative RNA binding protein [Plasmopara halstedii]